MAMEKIVKESQDKLTQERAQMTAKGSVLSGGMWKITANNYGEMIESLIRVRLESLLDAFELYGVPLDNEIESEILRDVTNLRELQIQHASNIPTPIQLSLIWRNHEPFWG